MTDAFRDYQRQVRLNADDGPAGHCDAGQHHCRAVVIGSQQPPRQRARGQRNRHHRHHGK